MIPALILCLCLTACREELEPKQNPSGVLTEVGFSLTAESSYRKVGHEFKNEITTLDEYGIVRP